MSLENIEKKLDKIIASVEKTHISNSKAIEELNDKVDKHSHEIEKIKENFVKKINDDGKISELKLGFYAMCFLSMLLVLAYLYGR